AYSIPTGSVLGPVLFNIYINNLPKVSKGKVFCYADDACVCYEGNDWNSTFTTATQDLLTINNWYSSMSLQLNLTKTNYMTFSITITGQPDINKTLTLQTAPDQIVTLTKINSTRYLGIQIDQHLKWNTHTKNLHTKLRHLMHVFNNLRRVCSKDILRMVYYAFVQSLLQYCICSWGGAYSNTLDPLRRSQNIILRLILHKDRLFHSDQLYSSMDVFNLHDLYLYKLILYSIKYDHYWTLNMNTYNTRQRGQAQIIRTHKSLTQRHFCYLGQKTYNIIPTNLKTYKNLPILLKLKTKEYIKTSHMTLRQLLPTE
ncbi:hypothetical protein WDU94_000018, partial [Cyamophila willieti]